MPVCSVDGCDRKNNSHGMCNTHRRRLLKHGTTDRVRAEVHGPIENADGYIMIWAPDHPHVYSTKRLPEHRLVMEKMLDRYLVEGENVHHKNGVRHDNRPANLELWITQQPKGQRVEDVVEFALEILRRYGPDQAA